MCLYSSGTTLRQGRARRVVDKITWVAINIKFDHALLVLPMWYVTCLGRNLNLMLHLSPRKSECWTKGQEDLSGVGGGTGLETHSFKPITSGPLGHKNEWSKRWKVGGWFQPLCEFNHNVTANDRRHFLGPLLYPQLCGEAATPSPLFFLTFTVPPERPVTRPAGR